MFEFTFFKHMFLLMLATMFGFRILVEIIILVDTYRKIRTIQVVDFGTFLGTKWEYLIIRL